MTPSYVSQAIGWLLLGAAVGMVIRLVVNSVVRSPDRGRR